MSSSNKTKSIVNPLQKTIAILQITRFGDLIQTTQAVINLKKQYPNYRLVLIARSQFARPLNFILKNYFDQVYYLDTKAIFRNTDTDGLKTALANLNAALNEIKSERIEVLINLSFSKSSCYLSSLIPSVYKIGPIYDLNNQIAITDKWSQMFYATVMRGNYNPFSLVDLFKNIIGIKEEATKSKHLSLVKAEKKKNIIIHPFASQERKTWKPEKWIEVIYRTLKDNEQYSISLVGAKDEILKSQIITDSPLLKGYSSRLHNLTGKTSLEELQNELKSSILFVGHDSMVGHMAAMVNTTTLTVSLGNVRPFETTPYQANAYNISPRTKCFPCFPSDNCSYFQCHHDIPYQVISTSINSLLEQRELSAEIIKKNISSFHLSSVNIHRSSIVDDKQRLTNLIDGHQDSVEIFKTLYRLAWSYIISGGEETFTFPKLNPTSHQDLLTGLQGLQHLFELADFGKRYSRYILEEIASSTPSVIKIKDFSAKIDEIDNLQKMVQKTAPHLAPIIDYFTVRKANLHGDNIVKLTESSHAVFEECADICRILYELVENTISEYKNTNNKNLAHRADNNK